MNLPNKDNHKELFDRITEFWKIVYECRQYYLYCYRLHKAKNQVEADYLNNSRFFRKTAHVYWRTLVIETAKLFSNRNSDFYNVQKFIKELSTTPEFVKAGINQSTLLFWEDFILKSKPIIDVVIGLRDRFYGHTDSPSKKQEVQCDDLTIQQLEPLITMAESVIKEMHLKVFDAHADCRVEFFEKDFEMLSILAEYKQEKIKRYGGKPTNRR